MFTLGSFSIFFWTLAGIILLMLVFEDKLLMLEEEHDRKKSEKKRAKTKAQSRNNSRQAQIKRVPSSSEINRSDRNARRNYAA